MTTSSTNEGSGQPAVGKWEVYHPFSFLDYAVWNGHLVVYLDQLGRLRRISVAPAQRLPSGLFEQLRDFIDAARRSAGYKRTRSHSLAKAAMCKDMAQALNAGFEYKP